MTTEIYIQTTTATVPGEYHLGIWIVKEGVITIIDARPSGLLGNTGLDILPWGEIVLEKNVSNFSINQTVIEFFNLNQLTFASQQETVEAATQVLSYYDNVGTSFIDNDREFVRTDINYDALGPNSNSVGNTLLNIMGINFRDLSIYEDGNSSLAHHESSDHPGHMGLIDGSLNDSYTAYVYDGPITDTTIFYKRNGDDLINLEWDQVNNVHAELKVQNENDSTGLTTIYFEGLDFEDVAFNKLVGFDDLDISLVSNGNDLVEVDQFYDNRTNDAAEGAQTTAFDFEDVYYRRGDDNGNILDASAITKDVLLEGFDGVDALKGGSGNDILRGGTGFDQLYGGQGNDTADYSLDTGAIDINMLTNTYTDGFGDIDTLSSIESFVGSDYDDSFTINNFVFNIDGGDGTDSIIFNNGYEYSNLYVNDDGSLETGHGIKVTNVEEFSMTGSDLSFVVLPESLGHVYDDSFHYFSYQRLDGGAGITATVNPLGGSTSTVTSGGLTDTIGDWISHLIGSNYADDFTITGGGSAVISGGLGNDTVHVSASNSSFGTYNFSGGNDVITGHDGISGHINISNNISSSSITASLAVTQTFLAYPVGADPYITGRLYDITFNITGVGSIKIEGQYAAHVGGIGSGLYVLQTLADINLHSYDDGTHNQYSFSKNINALTTTATLSSSSYSGSTHEGTISDDVVDLSARSISMEVQLYGGDDFITGTNFDDFIYLGDGDDTASGLDGIDSIYGGFGNDTITGGAGSDRLYGGAGHDKFVYNLNDNVDGTNYINDIYTGGSGTDTVTINATQTYLDNTFTVDQIIAIGEERSAYYKYLSAIIPEGPYSSEQQEQDTLDSLADGHEFTFHFGSHVTLNIKDIEILKWDYDNSTTSSDDIVLGTHLNDIVTASGGADLIIGGDGDDNLSGDSGNDLIYGGNDSDTIDGGSGADYIEGGDGSDVINGGSGVDTILGGNGSDSIDGGDGDDILHGELGADTITGGAGNDVIWGDFYSDTFGGSGDVLNGGDGDDTIYGGVGNDTLNGDSGADLLNGGSGNDILSGGLGGDSLHGGDGDDTLDGGDGNDTLWGDAGDDTLIGGAGIDDLEYSLSVAAVTVDLVAGTATDGYGGTDTITGIENITGSLFNDYMIGDDNDQNFYGRDGDDTLNGGGGIDLLAGGDGDDSLYGDAGDDILHGGEGSDIIDGGAGFDMVYHTQLTSAINANLETGLVVDGFGEIDTLINIEALVGTSFDDILIGSLGADVLWGEDGDDTLNGGAGVDSLSGGAGNDTFIYNVSENIGNVDYFYAGTGTDTLKIYLTAAEYSVYQTELDAYQTYLDTYADSNSDGLSVTTSSGVVLSDFEEMDVYVDGILQVPVTVINGTSGVDTLNGTYGVDIISGLAGNDKLYGYEGDDYLDGGDGHDKIWGNEGDDTILAGAGHDTIYGGDGHNTMFGDAGKDRFYITVGSTNAIDGGAGLDHVTYAFFNDSVNVDLEAGTVDHNGDGSIDDTLISIEQVYGSTANDIILGDSSANTLLSNSGDDYIDGRGGADTLAGNRGDDVIYGGDGDDVIHGGDGDDILQGDSGADTIFGNAGADTFVFKFDSAFTGVDVIRDFSVAEGDQFDLTDVLKQYDPATHYITDFVQITDDGAHSYLSVDASGGADHFVQIAQIRNVTGITNVAALITSGAIIVPLTLQTHAPLAETDIISADENQSMTGNLLVDNGNGLDSDPDGDALSVVLETVSSLQGGTVVILANGDFTYTPASNFVGNDSFNYTLSDGNGNTNVGLVNVAVSGVINGASGNDVLTGTTGDDVLYGFAGNDKLYGLAGDDTLVGGDGHDKLYGAEGDDILIGGIGTNHYYGGSGHNTMTGISGIDHFHIEVGSTNNIDGGIGGTDTVYYTYFSSSILVDMAAGTTDSNGNSMVDDNFVNITKIIGSTANDTILGSSSNDRLDGHLGDDYLNGAAGADSLYGKNGNDILIGGTGNDYLRGGNNDDILYGGDGLDQLLGDAGADTFVFENASAFNDVDLLRDFDISEGDKIDVSDLLSAYDPLNDILTDFVQITDDGTDSFLAIDADGGADNFIQISKLISNTGLTDEIALEASGNLIIL